ncbi:MAG: protein kinase [Planctomycetales bacterium]|nr:protein kinase [Planctomycetales bacterium]
MSERRQTDDADNGRDLVSYRCSCGAEVLISHPSEGRCANCGQQMAFRDLNATQTLSFGDDIDRDTSFSVANSPDRSGEELGHFRLLSKIGHGGMGAVYRAMDQSLERLVAVKVMRAAGQGADGSLEQVQKLLHEAVVQARLNHPNVVTIYYVGRNDEEPFFAMELLAGPTLGYLIRENQLPFNAVISYAQQVVAALKQASLLGLVHGDIKPGNLILADKETVKLCDFGSAKTEQCAPAQVISGTLCYMAPELATGTEPSIHSDMYSLGVTLFELTFGRRPFTVTGTTLQEQIRSQRIAKIEFTTKWPAKVPERWKELLTRLLAPAPEDRFPNYETFEAALQELSPMGFTNAGLLSRSMAFAVDLVCAGLLMAPFILPGQFEGIISAQMAAVGQAGKELSESLLRIFGRMGVIGILAPIVPAIATWIDWKGWRTPGRYMFQLRVVDPHGLKLGRRKRVLRGLMRNTPIWVTAFIAAAIGLQMDIFALMLSPLDEIVLLIDTIPVLGLKRQALHDRLFGSHVVLDTK